MDSKGILLATTDVSPEIEDQWNEWCHTRLLPDRLRVPGFLSARRFITIEGKPKYVTIYDLGDLNVLSSEAYMRLREREVGNPQDSFERLIRISPNTLTNHSSSLYKQIYPQETDYHSPDTDIIFTLGFDPPPDREEEFNLWYNTEHIVALQKVPGFVTARRFEIYQPELPTICSEDICGGAKYLTLYDLESEEASRSEALYNAAKTPWTAWVTRWYNRRFRFVARRMYPKP